MQFKGTVQWENGEKFKGVISCDFIHGMDNTPYSGSGTWLFEMNKNKRFIGNWVKGEVFNGTAQNCPCDGTSYSGEVKEGKLLNDNGIKTDDVIVGKDDQNKRQKTE